MSCTNEGIGYMRKPIALVSPWYGDQIQGGAEKACNYLAHGLQANGYDVEVFTTCVEDAAKDRGKNTIAPGIYVESGITVRRFPVKPQNMERLVTANQRIYYNADFTLDDEKAYIEEDINSPKMYKYIENHKNEYRCFLFTPYLYGITYNGSGVCPEKSIMIPCLHDESYAYMSLMKPRMNQLRGIVFLSRPESELAERLYGLDKVNKMVLGTMVDTDWHTECDAIAFRKKYQIDAPFILCAGRKDEGKKVDELCNFFIRYKRECPTDSRKLVLLGGGTLPVEIPEDLKEDIVDLGFVSIEDKHNAFAAAEVLCNPSYFESFSIVIMESWLAKRPVLVSEHCAVTREFCLDTNGGLYFGNYEEFYHCLKYFEEHPQVSNQMGENGFKYVMAHFTQDVVVKNYIQFIETCGL